MKRTTEERPRPKLVASKARAERLEDEIDVREARKVLAEMKRKGKKPIPLATLKRELGC